MGYCTSYRGKIQLTTKLGRQFVQTMLQRDNSNEHGDLSFYSSTLNVNALILNMDEDAKFYDNEIERILVLLGHFDKGATGTIESVGEDGENKKRLTLSNGKLFCEEAYDAYKPKKDITDDYGGNEEVDEISKQMDRFANTIKCENCGKNINLIEFDYSKRGYYEQIKERTGFKNLDEKCYRELKNMVLKIIEFDKLKQEALDKLPRMKGD